MANNKIQLSNGDILLDLTADTVTEDKLAQGYTAHNASGNIIVGTMIGGQVDETEYSVTARNSSRKATITFTGLVGEPREWRMVPANFSADSYSYYYINGGVKTVAGATVFICHGTMSTYDCLCVNITPTYSNGTLSLPAAASNYYYRSGTTYTLYYKI